jgi:uncharacterized protein (UPF0276 family)
LENISYYREYDQDMPEIEFINSILDRSGAKLLLDINNVFVNGNNHGYDPYEFVDAINSKNISYYHIAGHYKKEDFIIDTHGKNVIKEVKNLARFTIKKHGWHPFLLERDNFVPELDELVSELNEITSYIDNRA